MLASSSGLQLFLHLSLQCDSSPPHPPPCPQAVVTKSFRSEEKSNNTPYTHTHCILFLGVVCLFRGKARANGVRQARHEVINRKEMKRREETQGPNGPSSQELGTQNSERSPAHLSLCFSENQPRLQGQRTERFLACLHFQYRR
jgi:hypothetical protein